MTNGAPAPPAPALRRLDTPSAVALADLAGTFEDLQTVLRCCETLVERLAARAGAPPEDAASPATGSPAAGSSPTDDTDVVVEAVWTSALLSYARCFTAAEGGQPLTEDDLTAVQPDGDVVGWHQVLLQLRDHYADPALNPRERFSVGVARGDDGTVTGIAITSARQPLVDDLTVRQTGAIAYALSGLVNDRIAAQQELVSQELRDTPASALDELPPIEVEIES